MVSGTAMENNLIKINIDFTLLIFLFSYFCANLNLQWCKKMNGIYVYVYDIKVNTNQTYNTMANTIINGKGKCFDKDGMLTYEGEYENDLPVSE
jgi:hypothetical protein